MSDTDAREESRKRFEAYEINVHTRLPRDLRRPENGNYWSSDMQQDWKLWQAAESQRTPPSTDYPAILERERTQVAEGVTAICKALDARQWLTEGRGSYELDDDRWHSEFASACTEILTALEPLKKIARDFNGCPTTQAEVEAARTGTQAPSEQDAGAGWQVVLELDSLPALWWAGQRSDAELLAGIKAQAQKLRKFLLAGTQSQAAQPEEKEFQNETRMVMFRAGLIACREYMARLVESENPSIAASIRANWWPSLGPNPGPPRKLRFDEVTDGGELGPWPEKKIEPSVEALPVAEAFLVHFVAPMAALEGKP